MAAMINRDFIDSGFPFKDIVMSCGNTKFIGSPAKELYHWWGYNVALAFFHSKKIVHKEHFDLITGRG